MLSRPVAVPKPGSLVLERHTRRRKKERALEDAYAEVDRRDNGFSWVTGNYTEPNQPDPRYRREHHHLKGRRVRPEWVNDPNRIITVSREEHRLIGKGLVVEGDDARKRIVFTWDRSIIKPGKEPFRIKSKRWSMNRD